MTNSGGYQNLLVYQQALLIYDLTIMFCQKYLADSGKVLPTRRTIDQMIQAARSGKQNIIEASLEKSLKMNIKLTGVSRASFGGTNNLQLWDKFDPRVLEIRNDKSNSTNLSYWTKLTNFPDSFCNLVITLLHRENYLLDQLIRSLEQKFINEGGYSENLFKKRLDQRNKT